MSGTLTSAGRQTPELSADVQNAIRKIESRYKKHPGLKHFLWDHLARGEYDLAFLRRFALHYYEHVRVFRLYLAGAMTVVPVEAFQVILSEVIADEFGVRLHGEPDVDGHPELFRRFMRSLGLSEDDWEEDRGGGEYRTGTTSTTSTVGLGASSTTTTTSTTGASSSSSQAKFLHRPPKKRRFDSEGGRKNLLDGVAHYRAVHYGLFRAGLAEETLGAVIFGMERTTPHRHSKVLEGLRKFQARTGHCVDAQFFEEHVGVDEYHNTAMIKAVEPWFRDDVRVRRMAEGAVTSFNARQEFLDDLAAALGVDNSNSPLEIISDASEPVVKFSKGTAEEAEDESGLGAAGFLPVREE